MWTDDNAIYDDGEWITWTEINAHLDRVESKTHFPNADPELVQIFHRLLELAQNYYEMSGRHLQVYGDLGEIFGSIAYDMKPHRNYAQGSDGKIGHDFVEVKTITPFKSNNIVCLNLDRNFSKVLIVKINRAFEFSSKLIERQDLPKTKGKILRISWNDFAFSKGDSEGPG